MKKSAAPEEATNKNAKKTISREPLKKHELLELLLDAGARGINKLEAFYEYGETCLSTTISELGIDDGLTIERRSEPHIRRNGKKVHFTRYWLNSASYEAAKTILSRYRTSTDGG